MSVSVLILTLNEESNIADCINSVKWSDDIVVLDSFSTDRTVEIARAAGARVIQRVFDNYASQRNAGLNKEKLKHPWVLMLDADERVTSELQNEIEMVVEKADPVVCLFHMRRKDCWLGRWLRHSTGYPTWFGRLIRVGRVTVQREINEQYIPDGESAFLSEHLLHFPFNKGMTHWFERHNRYSSMEAAALAQEQRENLILNGFWSPDPVIRRQAMKRLAYRLPARPLLTFGYLYLVRLGFLDGLAGLRYCFLRGMYEYMIDIKMVEQAWHEGMTKV